MSEGECVRPQWTFSYYPNCQAFHELVDPALQTTNDVYYQQQRRNNKHVNNHLNQQQQKQRKSVKNFTTPTRYQDIPDDTIPIVEYLAHGYYRDTWVFHPPEGLQETILSYAVKHLRIYHDQDIKSLEKIKTEALTMERLTSSPVITNIYGHCGTSTIVEIANEITNDIVPYNEQYMPMRGRVKQSVLDKIEKGRKKPFSFNNYTVEEKLNIAIAMAEAIAEQHGYRESVIVNDDAHPDQWLVTNDGRYILNDMNNAVFLKWNFVKQEYCKYYSSYGGDYRAPEEVSDDGADVDETVDIWPMGNLLFSLLTGLWPYYTLMTHREVQKISNQGYKPYLNPAFLTSSFIERKMIDIMNQCHELKPEDRISIFDVVSQLKEIRTIYNATHGKTTKQHHITY
jgi:serine/threonine protein kinase